MRVYGRRLNEDGTKTWVVVDTDPVTGSNDLVYVTTLCQAIKLNLGESPFFANTGIPAHPSVVQQIAPDYYVTQLQQQFAKYFVSLIISRAPTSYPGEPPTYNVTAVCHNGTKLSTSVPIPT